MTLASLAVRLSMLFMGLLGASWYVYTARREARTLSMLEKALAAGAVQFGTKRRRKVVNIIEATVSSGV